MECSNNVELRETIGDLKQWGQEIKSQIKELVDNQYRIFLAEDVKNMFKIKDDKLEKWKKEGLVHTKLGHTIVFTWDDILSFLKQNQEKQ